MFEFVVPFWDLLQQVTFSDIRDAEAVMSRQLPVLEDRSIRVLWADDGRDGDRSRSPRGRDGIAIAGCTRSKAKARGAPRLPTAASTQPAATAIHWHVQQFMRL